MRLSQLARKLGVTQSELIDFINEYDDSLSLNAHTRINEPLLTNIADKFDPDGEKLTQDDSSAEDAADITHNDSNKGMEQSMEELTAEVVAEKEPEDAIADETVTTERLAEEQPQVIVNETSNEFQPDENMQENDLVSSGESEDPETAEAVPEEFHSEELLSEADDEDPEKEFYEKRATLEKDSEGNEIIRARLQKLEGIKVVGKIELPPPPKPKEKTDQEEEENRKERKNRRDRNGNRRGRKPETLKQKQERQKRKEEREKKKLERQLKAKKKKHYLNKIEKRNDGKAKPAKAGKSKTNRSAKNRQPVLQKSKNPVKRFWHWLNGKYDSY